MKFNYKKKTHFLHYSIAIQITMVVTRFRDKVFQYISLINVILNCQTWTIDC